MSYTQAFDGREQDSVDYVEDNSITTRSGGNLAWRCNNPGLIPPNMDANENDCIGKALGIAVFPEKSSGEDALLAYLNNPRFQRKTLQQLLNIFTPTYEIPAPEWDEQSNRMIKPWLEPETGLDVEKVPTEDERETIADFIADFNGWDSGSESTEELESEAKKRTVAMMSGQNVIINGRSAVHKDSGGMLNTVDICLTPSSSGSTPVPYPNIAMSTDADKTASSVKINGNPACHVKSVFSKSAGDEPGSQKGQKSGTIQGEASFLMGSNDVKIEGEAAVRAMDNMVSNKENTPPAPLMQPTTPPPQTASMEEKEQRDIAEGKDKSSVTVIGEWS